MLHSGEILDYLAGVEPATMIATQSNQNLSASYLTIVAKQVHLSGVVCLSQFCRHRGR